MEKEIKIRLGDEKFIYGTFVKAKQKSDILIIFVHGFTSHQNEHIFFNGAKFLTEKGFDTFRVNLYAGEKKDSRRFRDTKISLHGKDVAVAVRYFRKKYKKIYIVGHSYGGTSLLFVDQSIVDGFVFWDASYINPAEDSTDHMKHNKNMDVYILDWGLEVLVGKDFVNELKNFPDCGDLIKRIKKPVLFITAGKKGNLLAGKKYFDKSNNPKRLISIKTADHNFNNYKDEEILFRKTLDWLRTF